MPTVLGLTGTKNKLRVTWLKSDTTSTGYKIAGALLAVPTCCRCGRRRGKRHAGRVRLPVPPTHTHTRLHKSPAVYDMRAKELVPPIQPWNEADLQGAGTEDEPFTLDIAAADLPGPGRYAVRVAGVNPNGASNYSPLSEEAVFGERRCTGERGRQP